MAKQPICANYLDVPEFYSQKGLNIEFFHIPSEETVSFKAYLTQFDDKYDSTWNSEETYGRMDPIQTFKNTKRSISLGWDVPSSCEKEAREHLERASKLFRMLYPTYADNAGATSITSSPLFKLKFANLIQNVAAGGGGNRASAKEAGLVGTINGFVYSPDFEQGFFDVADGQLFPQTIKLSFVFTVLHTFELGWSKLKPGFRTPGFPYAANGGNKGDVQLVGITNQNAPKSIAAKTIEQLEQSSAANRERQAFEEICGGGMSIPNV